MAEGYSIVYMYHIFFIRSSVDGRLGCFHVLAPVNSASVNTGVHISVATPLQYSCLENVMYRRA